MNSPIVKISELDTVGEPIEVGISLAISSSKGTGFPHWRGKKKTI